MLKRKRARFLPTIQEALFIEEIKAHAALPKSTWNVHDISGSASHPLPFSNLFFKERVPPAHPNGADHSSTVPCETGKRKEVHLFEQGGPILGQFSHVTATFSLPQKESRCFPFSGRNKKGAFLQFSSKCLHFAAAESVKVTWYSFPVILAHKSVDLTCSISGPY